MNWPEETGLAAGGVHVHRVVLEVLVEAHHALVVGVQLAFWGGLDGQRGGGLTVHLALGLEGGGTGDLHLLAEEGRLVAQGLLGVAGQVLDLGHAAVEVAVGGVDLLLVERGQAVAAEEAVVVGGLLAVLQVQKDRDVVEVGLALLGIVHAVLVHFVELPLFSTLELI